MVSFVEEIPGRQTNFPSALVGLIGAVSVSPPSYPQTYFPNLLSHSLNLTHCDYFFSLRISPLP